LSFVIRTIDLRSRSLTPAQLAAVMPRPELDVEAAEAAAAALVSAVRERGAAALAEQAERFDGGAPASIRVPQAELAEAAETLEPALRAALEEAIRRVREASRAQVPPERTTSLGPGASVRQRWQPVRRVGLYVPGGKAVYPSSVVMNVVPAQVAGVESIASRVRRSASTAAASTRRSWPPPTCSASPRCMRWAARARSARSRMASPRSASTRST